MANNRSRILLISFNAADHDSLALGYIKAFALKDPTVSRRTQIEILSFSNEQGDVRQALYFATEFRPHLIGFSCYCWSMGNILELARSVKQIMPEVPLVAGGPEVGPLADQSLAENPALDVVVHDEGEAVFLDLIRHYFAGKGRLEDIAGISFRRGQEVVRNADRPPIKNLDEIASPYLTGVLTLRPGVTYLQTFRGCPFRCGFCYEGGRHKELRFFSYERVKAEVDLIMGDPSIRSFHFVDSVFNLNPKHLRRLAAILGDANRYNTRLRTIEIVTELVNEETLKYLIQAGVQSVETGPQTANAETQKRIGRYFDPEKFSRGVRLVREAGIEVWCDLIIGLPGDNFFRCVFSLFYTMALKPARIIISILHVLPGTLFFEHAERFGLAFDPEPPHYVLGSDSFPFEEIYVAALFSSSAAKEYNVALTARVPEG